MAAIAEIPTYMYLCKNYVYVLKNSLSNINIVLWRKYLNQP